MKTDMQLQRDVLTQLEWQPDIDAAQIGVTALNGVVTLTGVVGTYAEKLSAEEVTKRVYGVKGVANDIQVSIPGASQRPDAEVAAAVLNALSWDVSVPDEKIKVIVRQGWVTLEGEVEWQYQRQAAESDMRRLMGVSGVTNAITVKSPAKSSDVKHRIEEAFARNAEVDARRVGVDIHDGKVVLHGNFRSWSERDEAQNAAWSAPGVSEVDNRLHVVP